MEAHSWHDPTNSIAHSCILNFDFEGAAVLNQYEEKVLVARAAIIANDFNEITQVQIVHTSTTAQPSTMVTLMNGETIVGLPDYLVGGDYIRLRTMLVRTILYSNCHNDKQ